MPILGSLDLVGLLLPLLMSFVRVGCFLGGCCYGLPARLGVRYPETCFVPHRSGCRAYQPGADPQSRVFPIQLVEASAHAALFVALAWQLAVTQLFVGHTLWLYLVWYSSYRFLSDFFRRSSIRPRVGPLSEAQCVALTGVIISVSLIALVPL